MSCGDKFNRNCPSFGGSRISAEEVDGRPICGYPGCGKKLLGTGACVDGHSQNPADWRAEAERIGANLLRRAQAFPNYAEADGRKVLLFLQGQLEVLCRDENYLYTYRWDADGNAIETEGLFDSAREAADILDDYVTAADQRGAIHQCPNCGQFMGVDHQCPAGATGEAARAAPLVTKTRCAGEATAGLPVPTAGVAAVQQVQAQLQALLELDRELEQAEIAAGEEEEFEIPVTRIGYGYGTITVTARSEREATWQALDEAGGYGFSEDTADYEPEPGCGCGIEEVEAAQQWLQSSDPDPAEGVQHMAALLEYLEGAAEKAERKDEPRLAAAQAYLTALAEARDAPARLLSEVAQELERLTAGQPPADWEPHGDGEDPYPGYPGIVAEVDETNMGDVHRHGFAVGEWAMANELRKLQARLSAAALPGETPPQPAAVATVGEAAAGAAQLREAVAHTADLEEAMRGLLRFYEQAIVTQYSEGGMGDEHYARAQAVQREAEKLLGDRGWRTPPMLAERLAFRHIELPPEKLAAAEEYVAANVAFCQRVAEQAQVDMQAQEPAAYVGQLLRLRESLVALADSPGGEVLTIAQTAIDAATENLFPRTGHKGRRAALRTLEGLWQQVREDKKRFPSALLQEQAAAAGVPLVRYARRDEIARWASAGYDSPHLNRLHRMFAESLKAAGNDGVERTWRRWDTVRAHWQGRDLSGVVESCGFAYLDPETGRELSSWDRRDRPDVPLQPVVRLKNSGTVPIAALALEAAGPTRRRRRG